MEKSLRDLGKKKRRDINVKENVWKAEIYRELERTNRVTYLNVVEFDRSKLLNIINAMLKSRYAYIFNCQKTPEELIRKHAEFSWDE